MENMEENKLNSKKIGKCGRKVGWIVKWSWKYGRKVCWIMKRYEQYGRKPSWIVKRYGKSEEK
jgi:hypothetical protein